MVSDHLRISEFNSFRLFSYLSMAVLSIAIMVGLFLVFQHLEEEDSTARTQANQETLLENQAFLKQILEEVKNVLEENEEHEMKELKKMDFLLHLFNTTGSNVTKQNSHKLDKIIGMLSDVKPIKP